MALKKRVSIISGYCWPDSEVTLCWVKDREMCWKSWVETKIVSIRNFVNKDSWCQVFGINNFGYIPTQICKINDFERWFDGPEFSNFGIGVSNFDVEEKVEVVAQNKGNCWK